MNDLELLKQYKLLQKDHIEVLKQYIFLQKDLLKLRNDYNTLISNCNGTN